MAAENTLAPLPDSFSSRVARAFSKIDGPGGSKDKEWQLSLHAPTQKGRGSQKGTEDVRPAKRARFDDEEGMTVEEGQRWRRAEAFMGEIADEPDVEGSRMQAMIGMDDTLDHEEEEDEMDRLAEGTGWEDNGDWLLPEEEKKHLASLGLRPGRRSKSDEGSLPNSFNDLRKRKQDMRANMAAAARRLAEDDKQMEEQARVAQEQAKEQSSDRNLLHDLDDWDDSRPPDPKQTDQAQPGNDRPSQGQSSEKEKDVVPAQQEAAGTRVVAKKSTSRVPEYVKHPEKYTYYALDWSDNDDEQDNKAAFRALQRATASKHEVPVREMILEAPTFRPRQRELQGDSAGQASDASKVKRDQQVVDVAVTEEEPVDDMQVDAASQGNTGTAKQGGRKYRKRLASEVE